MVKHSRREAYRCVLTLSPSISEAHFTASYRLRTDYQRNGNEISGHKVLNFIYIGWSVLVSFPIDGNLLSTQVSYQFLDIVGGQ
jgi:hypothetical protein